MIISLPTDNIDDADNIDNTKVSVIGGSICTKEPVFCALVEEPYMEAFDIYLRENNIENIEFEDM